MHFHQIPLSIRLRDSSVFASYFGGRNQAVVDALQALRPGTGPTCVWLHGPSGAGKTHLLQALCARDDREGLPVAYLPATEAVGFDPELLSGYGEYTLVCLDDAQLLAGRDDWERALFRLHQELDERGGRLLVAAPSPPAALGFRLRDLASRLNGGLVMTLHSLDENEQIAALRLHAAQRGVELPDDAAQFLMRRLPRDMKSLCAFLDRLDQASLAAQRRLTGAFVREVLTRDGSASGAGVSVARSPTHSAAHSPTGSPTDAPTGAQVADQQHEQRDSNRKA